MKLKLNGDISEVQDGSTVSALLKSLKIEPACVAVEVNIAIVKKKDFEECVLKDGDVVEIVSFIGGG